MTDVRRAVEELCNDGDDGTIRHYACQPGRRSLRSQLSELNAVSKEAEFLKFDLWQDDFLKSGRLN
jgi:hypothetical protein